MRTLTSGNVTYPATDGGKRALRRIAEYELRIDAAKTKGFRSRLWVLVGWLVSEADRRPADEQESILADVDALVRRLNRRNAGVCDDN